MPVTGAAWVAWSTAPRPPPPTFSEQQQHHPPPLPPHPPTPPQPCTCAEDPEGVRPGMHSTLPRADPPAGRRPLPCRSMFSVMNLRCCSCCAPCGSTGADVGEGGPPPSGPAPGPPLPDHDPLRLLGPPPPSPPLWQRANTAARLLGSANCGRARGEWRAWGQVRWGMIPRGSLRLWGVGRRPTGSVTEPSLRRGPNVRAAPEVKPDTSWRGSGERARFKPACNQPAAEPPHPTRPGSGPGWRACSPRHTAPGHRAPPPPPLLAPSPAPGCSCAR